MRTGTVPCNEGIAQRFFADLAGLYGRVWPSVATMMKHTRASRSQVFRALKALEDRGEILTLRRTQPLSRLDYSSSTRIVGMRNVREYERTYLAQGGAMDCTGGGCNRLHPTHRRRPQIF